MKRRHVTADRLWRGTGVLARRYAARLAGWVRATGHRRDALLRLALLFAVGMVAWRIVRGVPALLWLIVPAWCVAAVRAAPAVPAIESAGPAPEVVEETPAEPPADPGPDPVLTLLRDLIADRPGVHLAAVLARLQEHGQGEGWTVSDVRSRLAALGVPSRRSVKVAGRVAWGVHRDDVPAPSPTAATERAA